jgi:hypothetical protein
MKIDKKHLRDSIEQILFTAIIDVEEVDITSKKITDLIFPLIDYLQVANKSKGYKINADGRNKTLWHD